MARRPVVLAWSGGKDAAWALHTLRKVAEVEVVALLTTVTEGEERVSMQGIPLPILRAQTRAAGIEGVEVRIPPAATNAVYEEALAGGLDLLRRRWPTCSTLAFGDLFLEDVRRWREELCARLGWTPSFPLFGRDTEELAGEMLTGGLRAHLCCVDTEQLDGTFAGRAFDQALLGDLPPGVDPCGERGEFHTCVVDGPFFSGPLPVTPGPARPRDARFVVTDDRLPPRG